MEPKAEHEGKPTRKERAKRYLLYALIVVIAVIIIYIFVWFGTQLGLQN